jgi:transcriptional regulator GlxA family with amidase domain
MDIQCLIFDGFDEMDVFGVIEPLCMAGLSVKLVSLRAQDYVVAAHSVKVVPEAVFDLANKPDLMIVPGGGWITRSKSGAWAESQQGVILQKIRDCHAAGVALASVCTGSMLLAKAGLLTNRPATTNHAAVEELKEAGAIYLEARVVDDGEIVTAAGITSSLDLGIYLVERFCGQAKAQDVSVQLEFERRLPIVRGG